MTDSERVEEIKGRRSSIPGARVQKWILGAEELLRTGLGVQNIKRGDRIFV